MLLICLCDGKSAQRIGAPWELLLLIVASDLFVGRVTWCVGFVTVCDYSDQRGECGRIRDTQYREHSANSPKTKICCPVCTSDFSTGVHREGTGKARTRSLDVLHLTGGYDLLF